MATITTDIRTIGNKKYKFQIKCSSTGKFSTNYDADFNGINRKNEFDTQAELLKEISRVCNALADLSGTDTLPRRCLNFNSVKGAKISASMRLAGRRGRSARYPKLSELTETQKQHCAWRLDRYSAAGLVWINRALRGVFGDLSVDDLFTRAGMKPRQAKIHATKTKNFNITLNQ